MLNDWLYWLTTLHLEHLVVILGGLLLVDGPRYTLSHLFMCLCDCARDAWNWCRGGVAESEYEYCPSVGVVLAGYNESRTIDATLRSLWGTYPRMEIVVVDDGSEDGMADVAREFAREHSGVLVLSRPARGGKSSALNFGLSFTQAEIIVTVDTDSHLAPCALWEIVQPLRDPQVGAVSATVRARNPFVNLATWLQAYEYLQTIFIGRMLAARLGLLAIVSGAFGAFRREALERVGAWDVGPGEDGDLSLRIRKSGYRIAFAPFAQCHSNVPTSWVRLFHQRRRWDRAVITFECRKHLDLAYFWQSNFRWQELWLLLDRWFFNVVCLYAFWVYIAWLCWRAPQDVGNVFGALYVCYLGCEVLSVLTLLFYSTTPFRDLRICIVVPFAPLYQVFLRFASVVAITEELLWRKSFRDNFVPVHVRNATWHW